MQLDLVRTVEPADRDRVTNYIVLARLVLSAAERADATRYLLVPISRFLEAYRGSRGTGSLLNEQGYTLSFTDVRDAQKCISDLQQVCEETAQYLQFARTFEGRETITIG